MHMRQIVYVSTAMGQITPDDIEAILNVSRRNNARDGLTGLLYFEGKRFLQVLEGRGEAITNTVARIERSPRHRALVILSERDVEKREFGEWTMAHRTPERDGDGFLRHVADLVANASPSVRATFEGFAQLRRAA